MADRVPIDGRAVIRIKRAYEAPAGNDGLRVLVDRLWPRGLRKAEAHIDLWLKDIAPSDGLRRWFGHDPSKWEEFKLRYYTELETRTDAVEILLRHIGNGTVTLIYSAKEPQLNNAVALAEYLARRPHPGKFEISDRPPPPNL